MTTVTSGTIIPPAPPITEPGAITPIKAGSPITAAAAENAEKVSIQTEAVKNLGGKVGGKRGAKIANLAKVRKIMMLRGGASNQIEVKNVPNMVSSGSVDVKAMYAGLLQTQNQAAADAQFDSLGHATPQQISHGGRRLKKKTRKHHNGRSKHAGVRKSRGSRNRTRRIRSRRH